MNWFPQDHGSAGCVVPQAEEEFEVYHFRPPPPAWGVVGVIVNLPPLLASMFLTEIVERMFPQLCSLMTGLNLLAVAAGVTLQWALVGRGVNHVLRKLRSPS